MSDTTPIGFGGYSIAQLLVISIAAIGSSVFLTCSAYALFIKFGAALCRRKDGSQ